MSFLKNAIVLIAISLFFLSCSDTSSGPEDPGNQDVQLFFKYQTFNELNTFDNTYQKDLILNGVIKVKFSLTKEEHQRILNKAEEAGFFSLPDTLKILTPDSIQVFVDPEFAEELRIKSKDEDHKTSWRTSIFDNGDYYDKLKELRMLIINIIEAKPEYNWLPPVRGGYL